MFPLSVVLVGFEGRSGDALRGELCDRRVKIERDFTDAGQAAVHLADSAKEVRLFLAHVPAGQDPKLLQKLKVEFAGSPIIALLADGHDPARLIAAMRAGACQVAPLPIQSADFAAALACVAEQFAPKKPAARVLAVSGVTGGCGATTLAVNLADDLAFRRKLNVLLVELSLQMGVLATYLDLTPKFDIQDVLAHKDGIDADLIAQALTESSEGFRVLPGPAKFVPAAAPATEHIRRLLECASTLSDVLLLDVPCTLDDRYFDTLTAADDVLLVAEQKIPSIRNLQMILETVGGDPARRVTVVNRYDAKMTGFTTKDLQKLLKSPPMFTVADDRASVEAAVNHGRPIRLEAAGSRALTDVKALTDALFGAAAASPAAPERGVMRRLMRAFA
jgi:pilus assembly protein CpaE